jgi:hypothetical protein
MPTKERLPIPAPKSVQAATRFEQQPAKPVSVRSSDDVAVLNNIETWSTQAVYSLDKIDITIGEAKFIRVDAERLKKLVGRNKHAKEVLDRVIEKTELRMAEILEEMPKAKGGRPPKTPTTEVGVSEPAPPPTLADVGISYNQASRLKAKLEDKRQEEGEIAETGVAVIKPKKRAMPGSKPPAGDGTSPYDTKINEPMDPGKAAAKMFLYSHRGLLGCLTSKKAFEEYVQHLHAQVDAARVRALRIRELKAKEQRQ